MTTGKRARLEIDLPPTNEPTQPQALVAIMALQDARFVSVYGAQGVDPRGSVRLAPGRAPGELVGIAPSEAALDALIASIKVGLERKNLVVEWRQCPADTDFEKLARPPWVHLRQLALDSGSSEDKPKE